MYIGAAGFLWLVRTWKVADLERKAAAKQTSSRRVDPLAGAVGGEELSGPVDAKTLSFTRRLFVWQKV
jgi:hypothetical protein